LKHRQTYRVTWEIDIDAYTPKQAAKSALRIMRDPESIANVFTVKSEKSKYHIDLAEDDKS
jgi:hypothetical protein